MTEKEYLEVNPNVKFLGVIKIGKGPNEFYTDKEKYEERRHKAWDSGHDLYCNILKDN
jgi:hypothetical protein